MKCPAGIGLLLLASLASPVFAHGGGGFRGPPGSAVPPGLPVPPGIDCDCAQVDCPRCSDRRLVPGDTLPRNEVRRETIVRWNDFASVRLTLTWCGEETRPVETHARLAPSALFAVTAGSIVQGDAVLVASLAPARDARRRYLWARSRGLDPFLVLRRGPGCFDVRAYPVREAPATVVTIEGFALAAAAARGAPRFYRTGDCVLVVRDTRADAPARPGEWPDVDGRRALSFRGLDAARREHGAAVDDAVEVPFVTALLTALTGSGSAASGDEHVLIAIEAGAGLPPRVGPAEPPPPPSAPDPPAPPPES